jgi:hypothetical protein
MRDGRAVGRSEWAAYRGREKVCERPRYSLCPRFPVLVDITPDAATCATEGRLFPIATTCI